MSPNLAEALHLLHPGRPFALRLLDCGRDGTVAGTFDDYTVAAEAVARYDGVASACYVHLHELKPSVGVMNYLKANVTKAISGKHIARYRWLLVDCDPDRLDPMTGEFLLERDAQGKPILDGRGEPKRLKCPSTEAELLKCLDRRDQVVAFLRDRGFPAPLTGMSGNGGHALFALDLPNEDEVYRLVAQTLQTLDLLFTGAGVVVDTSVFDPARIVKLYGTIAKKGKEFSDRPFRRSSLDVAPADVEVVPLDLLNALVERYEVGKTIVTMKPQEAALKPVEGPRSAQKGEEDGEEVLWYDLDELKKRVEIVEVARRLGLDPREEGTNWVAYCPAHADHRTGRPNLVIRPKVSFADNEGRVKCYRCDFGGDAIDLVEEAKGLTTKDAIRWLADLVGLQPTIKPPESEDLGNKGKGKKANTFPNTPEDPPVGPARPPRSPDSSSSLPSPDGIAEVEFGTREAAGSPPSLSPRVRIYEALLESCRPAADVAQVVAWLQEAKGLAADTLTRFGVVWLEDPAQVALQLKATFGEEAIRSLHLLTKSGDLVFIRHRLIFPFWVTSQGLRFPVYAQGRNPQAKLKSDRFTDPGGPPILYNVEALAFARDNDKPVFLCEGISDTLTLDQSGRQAVGLIGTQGFRRDWTRHFDGLDVYLALDGDEAGRKAADRIAGVFLSEGYPAPKVVPIPDGQDVTDFFLAKS